jgi:ribose-phosphate pyrophosphokinase
VSIDTSVRGQNVYVIHTSTQNVNDDYMKLFLTVDAMKRASARSICVIIPHY